VLRCLQKFRLYFFGFIECRAHIRFGERDLKPKGYKRAVVVIMRQLDIAFEPMTRLDGAPHQIQILFKAKRRVPVLSRKGVFGLGVQSLTRPEYSSTPSQAQYTALLCSHLEEGAVGDVVDRQLRQNGERQVDWLASLISGR
jgi:hypothetical protein